MSKVMLVTMGTSLFHSATWEPTPELLSKVKDYDRWTSNHLGSPTGRTTTDPDQRIQEALKSQIRTDNVAEWTKYLPVSFTEGNPAGDFMRYSAELATILKLANGEREAGQTIRGYLRDYSAIHLVHDSNRSKEAELPTKAAHHLQGYLSSLLQSDGIVGLWGIPGLSSPEPEELLGKKTGLGALDHKIKKGIPKYTHLDLIVSGGFKIYGIFLSPLVDSAVLPSRIFYAHEKGKIVSRGRPRSGAPKLDPAEAELLELYDIGIL